MVLTLTEYLLKNYTHVVIIDAHIKGDGEESLVELLKGNLDYAGINGEQPTQIKNLDTLAFPDYSDYELSFYTNKKRTTSITNYRF